LKSGDGEEACLEIEIWNGSDGGIAANGAEKRESERAQRGPLRCEMAGSLSPGFVGLSKVEAQNVKKSDILRKCGTGQRHSERANVRAKASQDKAKQSKGGAKIN